MGGVAGLLVGGPVVGLATAAGGAYLAHKQKGTVGKIARDCGDAVADAGVRVKKFDKKHKVKKKTIKGVKDGITWVQKKINNNNKDDDDRSTRMTSSPSSQSQQYHQQQHHHQQQYHHQQQQQQYQIMKAPIPLGMKSGQQLQVIVNEYPMMVNIPDERNWIYDLNSQAYFEFRVPS